MILITGASGIVGESIYNKFAGFYSVIGLAHSKTNKDLLNIDLTDADTVKIFFKNHNVDTIIHCACEIPSRSKLQDAEIYKRNLCMLLNILENIKNNVRFVNIGGTAIYQLQANASLTENAVLSCQTFYHLSKRHIEELLHLFYKRTKNLLNLRISSPYSLNRENDSILYKFIINAALNNKIQLWGSGNRTQAFTNTETLALSMKELLDMHISGDFNFVTTPSVSMLELAKKIKEHKKGLKIEMSGKEDSEDNCRTTIDISKVSKFITIKDTLSNDIKKILKRLNP